MKIDKPGTAFGPCLECKHQKCQQKRLRAAVHCPLCTQPIGYGAEYLLDIEDGGPVHTECVEQQEEAAGLGVQG